MDTFFIKNIEKLIDRSRHNCTDMIARQAKQYKNAKELGLETQAARELEMIERLTNELESIQIVSNLLSEAKII